MNRIRPRLLLVGLVPPETGGFLSCGVASHVIDLARQAAARGYEVSVLAPLRPGAPSETEGVRLLDASLSRPARLLSGARAALRRGGRSPFLSVLPWRERVSVLSWTERIRAAMATTRADLVHIHPLSHPAGPGLSELPGGIPVLVSDHGFWQDIRRESDAAKIRETARLATSVVSVSKYCLERQDEFGLSFRGSRDVIPNAVLAPSPAPRPRPDRQGRKRILFVAGVESVARKGLDILIQALAGSRELKSGADLHVIADEPSSRWAEAAMAAAGITGSVASCLSRRDVALAYGEADVLALPSRSESFGLVYLEALAAGTPVIGFAPVVAELCELLGPEAGRPFDARTGTSAELAVEIARVLDHPLDRDGLAARTSAVYAWDVLFPAFDRLYRRLLRA